MTDEDTQPETEVDADADEGADTDAGADVDADAEPDRTTIRTGRDFEESYRLDADEAGRFLIDLGEQLRDGDELTIATDEWELPFAFGEPVGLEIDFEGVDEPELEIELELPGRTDETAPDVE
ncbi:MAG: amphi-Trp domain-containing protein [Halobellus sp.]